MTRGNGQYSWVGESVARINFEDSLFKDSRFTDLMLKMGSKETAIGSLVFAWMVAQSFWMRSDNGIPKTEWRKQKLRNEIIEVGLAEDRGEFVYISGSKEQFAWIRKATEAGRRGGLKSRGKNPSDPSATLQPGQPSYLLSPISSLSSPDSLLKPLNSKEREESAERAPSAPLAALPDYQPIESVILERKVSEAVQRRWSEAFPDPQWVCEQVRKALVWEAAHPNRRKKNFAAFMSNWLGRDWDRRKTPVTSNRAEQRSRANYETMESVKQMYRDGEETEFGEI